MPREFQHFVIKGMGMSAESGDPQVHLGQSNAERIIPMEIGPFEASAILIELEGLIPPRPLTHDLLAQMFRTHGFQAKELQIYRKVEEQFLAKLIYKKGLSKHEMELRPSDGIALSLRLGFPIMVHQDIWDNLHLDDGESDRFPLTNEGLWISNPRPSGAYPD